MSTTQVQNVNTAKTELDPSAQNVAPPTSEQKANLTKPQTKPQSGWSQSIRPRFSTHDVKVQFGTSEIDLSSCDQKNPAFEYVFRPKPGNIEGYFPRRGTSLIGGASGSGKTTLVLDMANQLRQGLPFLGHSACSQPFTYISLERSPEGFERTCKRMNFDPRCFNFYRPTGTNRMLPLPELIEGLLSTPEHRESKIFFIEGMDIRLDDDGKHRTMNDPLAVAQLMGQLEDIGKKHDLTFIGTVGMPKMKPGEKYTGRDQIIGSSFWARHAETIFTTMVNAEESANPKTCTLQVWMRNGKDEEFTLMWKDGRLVEVPPAGKTSDHITAWLEKNRKPGQEFSIDNLVEGLKSIQPPITKDMIQYAIANDKNQNNLLRRGLIEKAAHGLYRWKGKPASPEVKKEADEKARHSWIETVQKIKRMVESWPVGQKHHYITVQKIAPEFGLLTGTPLNSALYGASKNELKGFLGAYTDEFWRMK